MLVEIIDLLRANSEIKPALTFWMSTISVVIVGLDDQHENGQKVINEIDEYLAARN